jgi:hypothetical protein
MFKDLVRGSSELVEGRRKVMAREARWDINGLKWG